MTGVIQLWTDRLWLEEPYIYVYAECGDYSAWGDDPYGKFFVYDVYGTPKPKSAAGKYGIQLRGMNGVTTLTDFSKLGYCVWAGTVYSDGKKEAALKYLDMTSATKVAIQFMSGQNLRHARC